MDMPPYAKRRIDEDEIAWLTTVTDSGVPAPNPVWFARDGDDLVVFSTPDAHKIRNIEQRPMVTLHFNSTPTGGDVVVITGEACVSPDRRMSASAPYIEKYEASIVGPLNTTVAEVEKTYNTEIRIRPTKVRGTPPADT